MSKLSFEQHGAGGGAFTGSFFVGNFLIPVIVGILSAITGGLSQAVGVMAIAFVCATFAAFVYGRTPVGAALRLNAHPV